MQCSITKQIYVLINEVESRESIWNILFLDYKERVKKSDARKEVAQILQEEQKLLLILVLVFKSLQWLASRA